MTMIQAPYCPICHKLMLKDGTEYYCLVHGTKDPNWRDQAANPKKAVMPAADPPAGPEQLPHDTGHEPAGENGKRPRLPDSGPARSQFYKVHRAEIQADLEKHKSSWVQKHWGMRPRNSGQFLRNCPPPQNLDVDHSSKPGTRMHLPDLPAFCESWADAVKVAWLNAMVELYKNEGNRVHE